MIPYQDVASDGSFPDYWPPEVAAQGEKTLLLLADLARLTPDEIGDLLQMQGVRGAVDEMDHCPIAVYLQRNGVEMAGVGSDVVFFGPRTPRWLPRPAVRLPASVGMFVADFDAGRYPALVATPFAREESGA